MRPLCIREATGREVRGPFRRLWTDLTWLTN